MESLLAGIACVCIVRGFNCADFSSRVAFWTLFWHPAFPELCWSWSQESPLLQPGCSSHLGPPQKACHFPSCPQLPAFLQFAACVFCGALFKAALFSGPCAEFVATTRRFPLLQCVGVCVCEWDALYILALPEPSTRVFGMYNP